MHHRDSRWQMKCKIIRNLVRGHSPTVIASILGCSRSQVYRVAERFVKDGLTGLVDRRDDNGQAKVDEEYTALVFLAVYLTPSEFGCRRPSWTLELLVIVAREKLCVETSTATMSRLLRRPGARRGRPKPYILCPWQKSVKTRRLNQIKKL